MLPKVQTTLSLDQTTTMIKLSRSLQATVIAAGLSAVVACSGRSQAASGDTAPAPSAPAATPPPPATRTDTAAVPPWLVVDSVAREVRLTLEVSAPPGASSALINGYGAGEARIVVPLGWAVKWDWRNADSTAPHSLVVMVQREKIPLEGGRAAFSNAMTRNVVAGLLPGQPDQSSFVADEAGWYWMLCGVPSHAIKGEWLELRVDPDAKTASVEIKK
ncbi:MAG: sulfocyanin-like copper-binding protein [Gemmatimonadales bacterium]